MTESAPPLARLLSAAVDARAPWRASTAEEAAPTDAWRVFHGAVEGRAGLTLDQYGPVLLAQTFREALDSTDLDAIHALAAELPGVEHVVWNHRAKVRVGTPTPTPAALAPQVVREHGLRFAFEARHRGLDPWLFLDFRAGRRRVQREAEGLRVLNLFAYTCTLGVAAAVGGAARVVNVDFAASALGVGGRNAALNQLPDGVFERHEADVLPTLRQLAGQPIKGRGRRRPYRPYTPEPFDLVVLDPPTWAKSAFGAVDPVRDYASLFKPCVQLAAPGAAILATNHVSTVDRDAWVAGLRRCAEKAGRPLADVEIIRPDPDFPSPDDRAPLKMAWCRLPG